MPKWAAARRPSVALPLALRAGSVSSALALLLIAAFPAGWFQAWDQPVDAALRGLTSSALILGARGLDAMGSIEWVLVLVGGLIAVLLWERRPRDAALVFGAFFIAEAGVDVLKALFERARPMDGFLFSPSGSFPSGHAMRGALIATLWGAYVWSRLAHAPRARLPVVGAIAAWGVAMAVSRLVLHVHWLSDVVVGSAIGVGIAATGVGLMAPAVARAASKWRRPWKSRRRQPTRRRTSSGRRSADARPARFSSRRRGARPRTRAAFAARALRAAGAPTAASRRRACGAACGARRSRRRRTRAPGAPWRLSRLRG